MEKKERKKTLQNETNKDKQNEEKGLKRKNNRRCFTTDTGSPSSVVVMGTC
jgi:hypothetical protein